MRIYPSKTKIAISKKPYVKLSLVLKLYSIVILINVSALVLQGFLVDAGVITLEDMVIRAGTTVVLLIAAYLAIELLGVKRGYIEDDVGLPS